MATGNVFDEMGEFWAQIADKNQTLRQIDFLKRNVKPDGYILDLACGTGRHSIPLGREGYCMVGVDVSLKLLRIAKQRDYNVQLVRGDLRFLPFRSEAFATAISMDTSLGYLPSEKEDTESLVEARTALKRGGQLIVDVFNTSHLTAKYRGREPLAKSFEYPTFNLKQKRTVSENGDYLCDFWAAKNKSDGRVRVFEHQVRLYDSDRLRHLLSNAGFTVKATFGDYEGQRFSSDSPRLIVIAAAK